MLYNIMATTTVVIIVLYIVMSYLSCEKDGPLCNYVYPS